MKRSGIIVALLALFTFSLAAPLFAQSRSRCASGLCNNKKKRRSGSKSPSNRKQYSQRGISAGKKSLNILMSPVPRTGDLDLGLGLLQVGGLNFLQNSGSDDLGVRFGLGAAYGINDNLEVGTYLLNVASVAGETNVGAPIFWGMFRGISDFSEYALRLGISVPLNDDVDQTSAVNAGQDFVLHVGTPIFIPAGASASIEIALTINGIFADPETQWIFAIPVKFQTNLTDEVFVGLKSSFILPEFRGDAMIIPLGFFAGYTVMVENRPLADIGLGFNFPLFVFPEVDENGDTSKQIITELFEIGVGANFSFRF